MKTVKKLLSGIAILSLATAVSAGRYDSDYSYARVVNVEPIYETYQIPQETQVCTRDNRYDRNHGDYRTQRASGGGAILGAIIGGAIGNRFGKGNGRKASTAAGVFVGAAIGANAEKHNRDYRYGNNRHDNRGGYCYTETEYIPEQRIVGYDVAYEYDRKVYHTTMQNHPGERVRVRVDVQVAEY
ncbi:MAG: glycine zipper 2TM domain-containing protein [Xanthomonadales bacterium]|jgi:uncharacterized protein YcfJ|nr:glycine zipper 2TM domain-containing protein [Xanthomonadales bacterium]